MLDQRAAALIGALLVTGFLAILGHNVTLSADPISERADVGETDSKNKARDEVPRESPKKYFAVLFSKGPSYVEGGGPQPGMADHVHFIKSAHADGVVPLAGPLFSVDEGSRVVGLLYFVRAENIQGARGVVIKDPLMQEGVVKVSSIWTFVPGVGNLD